MMYGRWDTFPLPIPRRGPGGIDGVVHAALCHTGKVLFITAAETTMLWDPTNTAASTFEDPVNQPDYSQLYGHHIFLPELGNYFGWGRRLGPNPVAQWGWRFDRVAQKWARTANS